MWSSPELTVFKLSDIWRSGLHPSDDGKDSFVRPAVEGPAWGIRWEVAEYLRRRGFAAIEVDVDIDIHSPYSESGCTDSSLYQTDLSSPIASKGLGESSIVTSPAILSGADVLDVWEGTVRAAFTAISDHALLEPAGADAVPPVSRYRSEAGFTLGHRRDDGREFLETRLTQSGSIDPLVLLPTDTANDVKSYECVVIELFRVLSHVGGQLVECMAERLGVDSKYFTSLMDLPYCKGKAARSDGASRSDEDHAPRSLHSDKFSSSVLRVCNYPTAPSSILSTGAATDGDGAGMSDKTNDVAFGSHTDTSFITVAPVTSNCGLEILDVHDMRWRYPEAEVAHMYSCCGDGRSNSGRDPSSRVVLAFVGECMQILTRSFYRACIHRVRVARSAATRVSCPLIMRGRGRAIVMHIDDPALSNHRSHKSHLIEHRSAAAASTASSSSSSSSSGSSSSGGQTDSCTRSDNNNENYGDEDPCIEDYIPDFSGTSMQLIHKMLDLKRQKCVAKYNKASRIESSSDGIHGSDSSHDSSDRSTSAEDWVLAAYDRSAEVQFAAVR